MDEISFKCDICGKECEELWSFSQYGDNKQKKADNKQYCEQHFLQAEAKYDYTLDQNTDKLALLDK